MILERNSIGYLEIHPRPTPQELAEFYNNQYFEQGQYAAAYTPEEGEHREHHINEMFTMANGSALLEVGPGEGFVLDYFQHCGWDVLGLDFTLDGIQKFHPHLAEKIVVGDFTQTLSKIERQFDLIVCDDVLEHLLDPLAFLHTVRGRLKNGGTARFNVPHDESPLHEELVSGRHAEEGYWLCPPAHLNYFSGKSLRAVLEAAGFRVLEMLGDWPIEINLFNPQTNYMRDKSVGKNCHYTRVRVENFIARSGWDKWLDYRRWCYSSGLARSLTAYCQ